jgi:hypothetical protein
MSENILVLVKIQFHIKGWKRYVILDAKNAQNNNSILTPVKRLIVDDRLTKSESKLN